MLQTLDTLEPGRRAVVVSLNAEGIERRRLLDLGFTRGSTVQVVKKPLWRPDCVRIRETTFALRADQNRRINVEQFSPTDWRIGGRQHVVKFG